jgi:hypothetical protein
MEEFNDSRTHLVFAAQESLHGNVICAKNLKDPFLARSMHKVSSDTFSFQACATIGYSSH